MFTASHAYRSLISVLRGKKSQQVAMGITVAALLLLPGCSHNAMVSSDSTPFFLAYDSPEIIRDQSQVATITSTLGLKVDGVNATPENMRSADYSSWRSQIKVVDVLPGVHSVEITHNPSGGPIWLPPITYDFKAGHIYNMYMMILVAKVEENTSADVAEKIAAHRKNAVFEQKKSTGE